MQQNYDFFFYLARGLPDFCDKQSRISEAEILCLGLLENRYKLAKYWKTVEKYFQSRSFDFMAA